MRRAITGALAAGTLVAMTAAAVAKDVAVVTSGGFTAAYTELSAGCEAATGATLKTSLGSSMGGAPDSIPSRLARREPVDIVIMARPALDGLVKGGQAVAGSEVDLARSTIAMAVKDGAQEPEAARAIIACRSSPKAAPVISKTGLDPVTK